MATRTVRNLPDEMHRALSLGAAQHGRSIEAMKPQELLLMGDALAALGHRLGVSDKDVPFLRRVRSKKPAKPMRFE